MASGSWFKDPSPLIAHDDGKSLEARLENTRGLITANSHFFVRNNSTSLDLDAAAWRLWVEGDAVSNPMELTYEDILGLPSRALVCYLECAGNHRAMFDLVQGRAASGTQWMTGGISNGEWVGASLSDVLTLAGIRTLPPACYWWAWMPSRRKMGSDACCRWKRPCTRVPCWPTPFTANRCPKTKAVT